jgi:hypothetical protein
MIKFISLFGQSLRILQTIEIDGLRVIRQRSVPNSLLRYRIVTEGGRTEIPK